jgi:hypothetical protein
MLDRKLHRIVLNSARIRFSIVTFLAQAIEKGETAEFIYIQNEKNESKYV